MTSAKAPDAIDKLVGRNVRIQRLSQGLSQTELGEKLGVTFQQVQKYEKGVNRIGCGRAHQIAGILGVDITALFDGAENGNGKVVPTHRNRFRDMVSDPQAFQLVEVFKGIEDPRVRRQFIQLARSVATQAGA